ncbi:hypothetical protein AAW12_24205 [Sphingobacterium sp. Ag1]|uniref:hypothetical protein n=1 Tax=Sphingobacterium sp. Ag1 TaxID=1643451 RepID=UPI000627FA97|nr:hypothetical protein [Sphingobacterium sp. Ag1]KKO89221.1 hypothetical protein AAW12_24205 [Sphingobacterium sp. Ag1]
MKTTLIFIGIALLVIIAIMIFNSCSRKITRTLLTDNKIYHWKIYHTTENNYPAGKFQYFEVFLGEQKLVLPKELTGGVRDISQFHAAGSFGNHETDYNAVLIVFEGISKNENGFEQRHMVSIKVSPLTINKLLLTNMCSGQATEMIIKNEE